jgi:hypothetical protein
MVDSAGKKFKMLRLFLEKDCCLDSKSVQQEDYLIIQIAKPVRLDSVG